MMCKLLFGILVVPLLLSTTSSFRIKAKKRSRVVVDGAVRSISGNLSKESSLIAYGKGEVFNSAAGSSKAHSTRAHEINSTGDLSLVALARKQEKAFSSVASRTITQPEWASTSISMRSDIHFATVADTHGTVSLKSPGTQRLLLPIPRRDLSGRGGVEPGPVISDVGNHLATIRDEQIRQAAASDNSDLVREQALEGHHLCDKLKEMKDWKFERTQVGLEVSGYVKNEHAYYTIDCSLSLPNIGELPEKDRGVKWSISKRKMEIDELIGNAKKVDRNFPSLGMKRGDRALNWARGDEEFVMGKISAWCGKLILGINQKPKIDTEAIALLLEFLFGMPLNEVNEEYEEYLKQNHHLRYIPNWKAGE